MGQRHRGRHARHARRGRAVARAGSAAGRWRAPRCRRLDDAELAAADAYEVADYARALRPLASGAQAWVYLAAAEVPAGPA